MNWTDSWQCLPDHRKYQERGHLPQKWSQEICLLLLVYDHRQGSCCMCPGSNRKCQGSRDCRGLFWVVSLLHPTGVTAVSIAYVSQANFWMSLNVPIKSHNFVRTDFRLSKKFSPAEDRQLLKKQPTMLKYWRHWRKHFFKVYLINPGKQGVNFYNSRSTLCVCLV